MKTVQTDFGKQLRKLRTGDSRWRTFTQQELAEAAGLKHSHVSEIERHVRPCGPQVAARLATALSLKDHALRHFMSSASRTTQNQNIWVKSPDREAIMKLISRKLKEEGVDENKMLAVASLVSRKSDGNRPDMVITMADGQTYVIEIKVQRRKA